MKICRTGPSGSILKANLRSACLPQWPTLAAWFRNLQRRRGRRRVVFNLSVIADFKQAAKVAKWKASTVKICLEDWAWGTSSTNLHLKKPWEVKFSRTLMLFRLLMMWLWLIMKPTQYKLMMPTEPPKQCGNANGGTWGPNLQWMQTCVPIQRLYFINTVTQ